jgi:hypothetical protein
MDAQLAIGSRTGNLSRADVSPKMAQTLARHSTINLTPTSYGEKLLDARNLRQQILSRLSPTFAVRVM